MKLAHIRRRGKSYIVMNLNIQGEKKILALSQSEIDSAMFRAMRWQKEEKLSKVI